MTANRTRRRALTITVIGVFALANTLASTSASAVEIEPLGTDPCGVSVDYGAWVSTATGSVRRNTWLYNNCSTASVKRLVRIDNAPDSSCFTIAAKGVKTWEWNESIIFGVGSGAYQGTASC